MSGGQKQSTTRSNSTTESSPWGPAIGPLKGLLNNIGSKIDDELGLTATERTALQRMGVIGEQTGALAGQFNRIGQGMLDAKNYAPGVTNAYNQYKASLQPFASGSYVDPSKNQALQGYLGTISNDVQNRVNSMFAGSGRDMSGMNQQTLARGIAEGQSPVLLNAYNSERDRQMGAINNIYGGAQSMATTNSGLDAARTQQQLQGAGMLQQGFNTRMMGPQLQLQAEAMRRNIPMEEMQKYAQMLTGIGGMGGTQNTSGKSVTSQPGTPVWQQALGGVMGGAGALGQTGAFGQNGWLSGLMSGAGAGAAGAGAGAAGMGSIGGMAAMLPNLFMLSDRRLKRDIETIGETYDGQPIYRFRYLNDDTMRIGLMADDVEKRTPEAVHVVDGFKMVDYAAATDGAVR